jgi:hypothetical protein
MPMTHTTTTCDLCGGKALVADGLTRRFGDRIAVDHVSFDVGHGEVFGFLGPNGAGKSTTARMLTGFMQPTSGRALIAGLDVATQASAARRLIGVVPEEANVYADLSVLQNVLLMAELHGISKPQRLARASELLQVFDMQERKKQKGRELSKMTMSKLLGFDLCPQMRDLAERRLYLPRSVKLPENLERIALTNVSERAIHKGWDELLRLIASIRSGRLTPKEALEKMGSSAQGDPLHKAADQLGRLLRTLFLCDYFSNPEFRREMHTLLNRGESVHQLQRAIYFGRLAAERGRRRDEIRAVSGSHALLTNLVIAWNTMKMQHVVDRWRKEKHPIEDAWLRRMGPVHFG